MIGLRRYAFLLLMTVCCLPFAAFAGNVRIEYSEPLEDLGFSQAAGEFQKPGVPSVQRMRFNAFSRHFDVELQLNHALIDAVERQSLGADVQIYRGSLAAEPDSWVRMVIAQGQPRGMLFDGSEMFAIEVSETTGKALIYRLADLHIEPGALACAEAGMATSGADLLKTVVSEMTSAVSSAPGASSQIDVAVIADFEFATDKGSDAQAAMITRMNNVDGIFSSQLGVQINVNRVDVFSSSNDPFSDQTDSSLLLDEVSDYRSDTSVQRANGLTHLFTGRNLDGSTVGIAFGGALCSSRFGAGLTQATSSVTTDTLIVAHELGHNFGAPHDGTSGACESTPQDFLMAPRINGSDTFSSCSISQMQDNVARASCITALASNDVAVAAGTQSATLLLGDSTTVSFDLTSAGTDAASNVSLSVTVPVGVTLDSSSTTAGSCTDGAGSVNCSIGTLAAGSGATVSLSLTSQTVGSSDVVATASASGDANSNNNEATIGLTVNPAIDLATITPTVAQLQLNQAATLRPRVENQSSIVASDAVITVAIAAGLRIDSATWPVGDCTVSGGEVRCTAPSLAANSTTTIDVQVTAVAEGQHTYSTSAAAGETDRDSSNNESSAQVTVTEASTTAPPDNEEDSGGGSMGLVSLLFLCVVTVLVRGHSRPFGSEKRGMAPVAATRSRQLGKQNATSSSVRFIDGREQERSGDWRNDRIEIH